MRQTYLEFCEAIKDATAEEAAWLVSRLDYNRNNFAYGLCVKYDQREQIVTISGDEDCAMEIFVEIMQEFLQLFRPGAQFHIHYAITSNCDKPRAFGGGWVVVTEESQQWHDAHVDSEKEIAAICEISEKAGISTRVINV